MQIKIKADKKCRKREGMRKERRNEEQKDGNLGVTETLESRRVAVNGQLPCSEAGTIIFRQIMQHDERLVLELKLLPYAS